MVERRRLDESVSSRAEILVVGLAWLVSAPVFAASLYAVIQLQSSPATWVPLIGIGAILSFMVAVPTTLVILYGVARYLYYHRVTATLTLSTNRPRHLPGEDIRVSVSIYTDQELIISSGTARLRQAIEVGEGGWDYRLLSQSSLRPWGEQHLSPGEAYEWTAVLSLPASAMKDLKGTARSNEISIRLDVSLRTSPRTDAKVEIVVLGGDSHGPQKKR